MRSHSEGCGPCPSLGDQFTVCPRLCLLEMWVLKGSMSPKHWEISTLSSTMYELQSQRTPTSLVFTCRVLSWFPRGRSETVGLWQADWKSDGWVSIPDVYKYTSTFSTLKSYPLRKRLEPHASWRKVIHLMMALNALPVHEVGGMASTWICWGWGDPWPHKTDLYT